VEEAGCLAERGAWVKLPAWTRCMCRAQWMKVFCFFFSKTKRFFFEKKKQKTSAHACVTG
jgi:hypothetical protein